jgi:hypothetical protein
MLEILKRGKEHFGYVGVKAEFEAEGTRMDEMLRLMDVTRRAGLNIGLKIGGCEAVRDLIDCKQIGADYIIAPMVESPYALSKFIQIKNKLYTLFERKQAHFLFNVETNLAFGSLDPILKMASMTDGVGGVVFGRVDYSGSCGLPRSAINDQRITDDCITVAKACKAHNLDFVVGGGVAKESIAALKRIRETHLTRFETRKVIFSAHALEGDVESGLINANEFELCWLQNKREYYLNIADEDIKRIEMLEARLQELKSKGKQEKRAAVA